MPVTQVNAFSTSDGRLHKDENEALKHELYLELDKVFEAAFGRHYRFDSSPLDKIITCRKELVAVLS